MSEDQAPKTSRRKSNRAAKKTGNEPTAQPAEGQVETKTKDGRHRRQLPSGAIALV